MVCSFVKRGFGRSAERYTPLTFDVNIREREGINANGHPGWMCWVEGGNNFSLEEGFRIAIDVGAIEM
jgi:hypothetical protein